MANHYTGYFKICWCLFFSSDPKPETGKPQPKKECVFPFTYGGREHEQCITEDNYGVYWCGTASNVDTNKNEWKLCDE